MYKIHCKKISFFHSEGGGGGVFSLFLWFFEDFLGKLWEGVWFFVYLCPEMCLETNLDVFGNSLGYFLNIFYN